MCCRTCAWSVQDIGMSREDACRGLQGTCHDVLGDVHARLLEDAARAIFEPDELAARVALRQVVQQAPNHIVTTCKNIDCESPDGLL